MLRLPALETAGAEFAPPISDRSVIAWRDARRRFARGDTDPRALADRIAVDPPLLLWLSHQNDVGAVLGLRESAEKAAAGVVPSLNDVGPEIPLGLRDRVVFLVRRSLLHARLAFLTAIEAGAAPCRAEQAYVAAVRAHLPEWRHLLSDDETPPDPTADDPFVHEAGLRMKKGDAADTAFHGARAWSAEQADAWAESLPESTEAFQELASMSNAPAVSDEPDASNDGPAWDAFPRESEDFEHRLEEEKLASLAEFTAGLGHDFNNPLAIIRGRAELLLRSEQGPERRRDLAVIVAQTERAFEMIADLRLFSRPPKPEFKQVDLPPLLRETVERWSREGREIGVEFFTIIDGVLPPITADPVQLRVALDAMCKNAAEAIENGGRVELHARGVKQGVEIVVQDDGPGIPPEHRRHIFDPFFSSRQAGRGLGFGLSKAWRIVQTHGGSIEVESEPGEGARFVIRLPLAPWVAR